MGRTRSARAPIVVVVAMVALALLVVASAGPVSAHAAFAGSVPGRDEVLATVPDRVVVRFAGKEATLAGDPLRVYDDAGARIDASDVRVEQDGAALSVGLRRRPDPAGRIHVHYQVVSADTHVVTDRFTFTVVPPPVPRAVGAVGRAAFAGGPAGVALERGDGSGRSATTRLGGSGAVVASVAGLLLVGAAIVLVQRAGRQARRRSAPAVVSLTGRRSAPAPEPVVRVVASSTPRSSAMREPAVRVLASSARRSA